MFARIGIRTRVTLAVTLTVTVAVSMFAGMTWLSTSHALHTDLDNTLAARAAIELQPSPSVHSVLDACTDSARPRVDAWLIDAQRRSCHLAGASSLPADALASLPIDGLSNSILTTLQLDDGEKVRYLMTSVPTSTNTGRQWSSIPAALVVGQSLQGIQAELRLLATLLVAGGMLIVALAALAARAFASTAVAPLRSLAEDIEHVTHNGDRSLRTEIPPSGDDIALLAERFNELLDSIEAGELERSRLIGDASHELRTPLLGIRTNIELLRRGAWTDEDERNTMLDEVTEQVVELVGAVEDLVRLAREHEQGTGPAERVDLAGVVAEAAARARRHFPTITVRHEVPDTTVTMPGTQADIARATNNLLDNACRWSGEGGAVTITLAPTGAITVTDSGPGFRDEDLPHVFERFYRSPAARALPGTGLGLSIVRAVAERHGGTATAANAPGGGAVVTLRLPASGTPQHAFSPSSARAATIGEPPPITTGPTMPDDNPTTRAADTPTSEPAARGAAPDARRHVTVRIPLPGRHPRRPSGKALRTVLGLVIAVAAGAATHTLLTNLAQPFPGIPGVDMPASTAVPGTAPGVTVSGLGPFGTIVPNSPEEYLRQARVESTYAPALTAHAALPITDGVLPRLTVAVQSKGGNKRTLRMSGMAYALGEDQQAGSIPSELPLDRVAVTARLGSCGSRPGKVLATMNIPATGVLAQASLTLPTRATYRDVSIWVASPARSECVSRELTEYEYNAADAQAAWFHARCGKHAQVQPPGILVPDSPAESAPNTSSTDLPLDPRAQLSDFPAGACRKTASRLAAAWRERVAADPTLAETWNGVLRR